MSRQGDFILPLVFVTPLSLLFVILKIYQAFAKKGFFSFSAQTLAFGCLPFLLGHFNFRVRFSSALQSALGLFGRLPLAIFG